MNAVNANKSDAMRKLGWSMFLVHDPLLNENDVLPQNTKDYLVIKSDSIDKIKFLNTNLVTYAELNKNGFHDKLQNTVRELDPSNPKDVLFSVMSSINRRVLDLTKWSDEDIVAKAKTVCGVTSTP